MNLVTSPARMALYLDDLITEIEATGPKPLEDFIQVIERLKKERQYDNHFVSFMLAMKCYVADELKSRQSFEQLMEEEEWIN